MAVTDPVRRSVVNVSIGLPGGGSSMSLDEGIRSTNGYSPSTVLPSEGLEMVPKGSAKVDFLVEELFNSATDVALEHAREWADNGTSGL
jgi:hypothetical protein